MSGIARYVFSIICVALLCSILRMFFLKNSRMESVMKLITGLLISVTVLRPVVDLEHLDISKFLSVMPTIDQTAFNEARLQTSRSMEKYITDTTQAYILQQAQSLGVEINVNVMVSQDAIPVPVSVTITGDISPYKKQQLISIIEKDLAIVRENQKWI